MIKKVIIAIIVVLIIFSCTAVAMVGTTTSEDYIPSETEEIIEETPIQLESGKPLIFVDTNDRTTLNELIAECEKRKTEAHNMAEAARACGYPEDHPVIVLAKNEWGIANNLYLLYKEKNTVSIKAEAMEEYPVATQVWLYLKDLGYNDYVCAGIVGNMMAEVGGGTLNLRWNLGTTHYGLCQWSKKYFPAVQGAGVEEQLDFLKGNIKAQMDTYGKNYKKGFNYDKFLMLEDEREAAMAFAKCYERCASQYYNIRLGYAEKAYNYFVN